MTGPLCKFSQKDLVERAHLAPQIPLEIRVHNGCSIDVWRQPGHKWHQLITPNICKIKVGATVNSGSSENRRPENKSRCRNWNERPLSSKQAPISAGHSLCIAENKHDEHKHLLSKRQSSICCTPWTTWAVSSPFAHKPTCLAKLWFVYSLS